MLSEVKSPGPNVKSQDLRIRSCTGDQLRPPGESWQRNMSDYRSPLPQIWGIWLVYSSKVRPIARLGISDIGKEALPASVPHPLGHHFSPQPQVPEVQQFPLGMYEIGLTEKSQL